MREIKGRNGGTLKTLEPGDRLPGSGNPGGETFKTIAKRFLAAGGKYKNPMTNKMENLTGMQVLFLRLWKIVNSSKSDFAKITAIKEILERVDGKVTQPLDIDTNAPPSVIQLIRTERYTTDVSTSEQEIKDREGL